MVTQALLNHRYQLVERLGDGADAAVYLVMDTAREQARRAIKVLRHLDGDARERLAGEFRRLGSLSHPRLVRVYDLEIAGAGSFVAAGSLLLVVDHVGGKPPSQALAQVPEARRAEALLVLCADVAAALAHVHGAGFIHHDVKPENLLVDDDGRATLLDLGLATAQGAMGQARGTPAYMAPEALLGVEDPRLDLYALGATLYELVCGRPPFVGEGAQGLIRAILEAPLASPREQARWLPPALERLIAKLLSRDADERPSSARVLLAEIARLREGLGWAQGHREAEEAPSALLPPPLVGRQRELEALEDVFTGLAEGHSSVRTVLLCGVPGVGKTRLFGEALRRHQLKTAAGRSPAIRVISDRWSRLLSSLSIAATEPSSPAPEEAERQRALQCDRVAQALEAEAQRGPVLVHLADAAADERAAAFLALWLAQGGIPGALIVAELPDAGTGARSGDGVLPIALPALTEANVELLASRMLGVPVSPAWSSGLWHKSAGVSRLVVDAVRACAVRAGVEGACAVPVDEVLGDGLASLMTRWLSGLSEEGQEVLQALAVLGSSGTVRELCAMTGLSLEILGAEISSLAACGLVCVAEGQVSFPSRAHGGAVYDRIDAGRRAALHRAALELLSAQGKGTERAVARHLCALGPADRALAAGREAALVAKAERDLAGALAHLSGALALAPPLAAEALVEKAELAVVLGRYDEALGAAEEAARSPDAGLRHRAQRMVAKALARKGELDLATDRLRRLVESAPEDEEARGALSRLLCTRGRYAEASEIAGAFLEEEPQGGPITPGRALRLEAAGLAALYTGERAKAEALFARLEAGAQAAGDRIWLGRAHGLLGLFSQLSGDMGRAEERYREALTYARVSGDVHAANVYALNRATVLLEQGYFGEVLTATDEALRGLCRLGRVAELAPVLFNRGLALLALGDLAAGRRAAERALAEAQERGLPLAACYAALLEGDVLRAEGASERALSAYARAAERAQSAGAVREQALCALNRAELLAELGRGQDAHAALVQAEAWAVADDDRDRVAVSLARVVLSTTREPERALPRLLPVCQRLRDTGRLDLAWRADLLAARLRALTGDRRSAAELLLGARRSWDLIFSRIPEEHREGALSHPDVRALAVLEDELLPGSLPGRPSAVGGVLERPSVEGRSVRRLLALSKRLGSELRLERVLDDVIDTVIELSSAERGFLLLEGEGGLEVRVARNIDRRTLEGAELAVSRSIAEKAARTGEPVFTVDAAIDDRFGAAASVSALKLRSVMAVPLRVRGQVVGTIYLDHRFRRGAFDEDSVELVLDFADIAAIAVHNARLVAENDRQRREVVELNERLAAELERQRSELDGARAALRQTAALELRYPYDALIGRSPCMLELLRLVDRATETTLPVVIHGESGTGKELVARALHHNGPRRERAFVAINCAAVPEPLLEAELFGHVRGAFTGADRDRRGLFEVADGGTLFLDEIADTSPAMQGKLLRVLQDGEIRRVGGDRSRSVDVRVVAAANRDLRKLVEEERFREDLFYRLHVIRLDVPPLRERSEDIPVLVAHFLHKMAGPDRPQRRVDRAALARLCAHPWPGNVRELENEIARAAALGGEVLGVADLSPAIAAADPTILPSSADDLRLKPRVERMERALLREALSRHRGNQTLAAKDLGLSRFGLQKKLRRYGL
jgi:transcriptional regulator with GAF, ATPase, and Fis domain/tetratricopeptide (TPR) repeat protein/tRNA A-37 threonylcarbamoyl transferase component Bud32